MTDEQPRPGDPHPSQPGELDDAIRDHVRRLEAAATLNPYFARAVKGRLRSAAHPSGRRPRWAMPALAATIAVAAIIGGGVASTIFLARDIALQPSPTVEAVEPSAYATEPDEQPSAPASPSPKPTPSPRPVPTFTATPSPVPPTPLPAAQNGAIAYVVMNSEIWVTGPNGGDPIPFVTSPADTRHPLAWSYDGAMLAFGEIDAGGKTVEVIGADGSNLRTVMSDFPSALAWAPESNRLAIAGLQTGIQIVDFDTGEQVPLPNAAKQALEWSPSGRYLAWLNAGPGAGALGVHDSVSGQTRIVPADTTWVSEMTWHPDERHLFIGARSAEGDPWILSTVDIDTGAVVAHPSGLRVFELRLSPDGRWFAYVTTADASGSLHLGVVSLDAGTVTPLDSDGGNVSWAPDSSALVVQHKSGTIRRVPIDGSGPVTVGPHGLWPVQQPLR